MMGKKIMTLMIASAFMLTSLFVLASCAKKQIQGTVTKQPTSAVGAGAGGEVSGSTGEMSQGASTGAPGGAESMAGGQKTIAEMEQEFESEKIYFDFDRWELKSLSQANLRVKASFLGKNPEYTVIIEGHCDERGTNEYNLALGERRAHAAKTFLVDLGIPADRIKTISYGEERPSDPAHNEAAWAENRRDEFKLSR